MEIRAIDPAAVSEHCLLLAGLGISLDQRDRVVQVIIDATARDHYPVPDPVLPLLPGHLAARAVGREQETMNRTRHLWGPSQRARLNARADFFLVAATVMDMRAGRGDTDATACAAAMRAHAVFLTSFEGTRSPFSHD